MPPRSEPFFRVIERLLKATGLLVAHIAVGVVAMGAIWASEQAFTLIFHASDPKFFDICPVRWIFDAGEGGILLVLVILGIWEVIKQLLW